VPPPDFSNGQPTDFHAIFVDLSMHGVDLVTFIQDLLGASA
jgi:hypothetical protein